jgi:VanZ family protein
MRLVKNKNSFYTLLFILYTIAVIILTTYPKLKSPIEFLDSLSPDKIVHFLMYFFFAFTYYKFRQIRNIAVKEIMVELFLLAMIISVFSDIAQIPIPGRQFSWWDITANLLGFLTCMTIIWFYNRKKYAQLNAGRP